MSTTSPRWKPADVLARLGPDAAFRERSICECPTALVRSASGFPGCLKVSTADGRSFIYRMADRAVVN